MDLVGKKDHIFGQYYTKTATVFFTEPPKKFKATVGLEMIKYHAKPRENDLYPKA